MKDKEYSDGQANAAFLEDSSQEIIKEKEEAALCEIDDKSGQPTCCGPGDLSKISTPVTRKKK